MFQYFPQGALGVALLFSCSVYAQPAPPPAITLPNAVERALQQAPTLQAAAARQRAAAAEAAQAGVWANPQVSVEAENIGGRDNYSGFNRAEITYGVTQSLELWGKRGLRMRAAQAGSDVAQLEAGSARFQLIQDVTAAFADVVAAQQALHLAREQLELSNKVAASVSRRVTAAREPVVQQSKAELAQVDAQIAVQRAENEAEAMKHRLALFWGDHDETFTADEASFRQIAEPQPLASLEASITQTPDAQARAMTVVRQRTLYDLEKRRALPDPTLSAGVRQLEETNDQAFVVGLSVPIPVFDRNRGNIERARQDAVAAEADNAAITRQREAQLITAYSEMAASYQEVNSLEQALLPAAQKAFDQAEQGYLKGGFSYLEVLDAQRSLADARQRLNNALKRYHLRKAEIEGLTATIPSEETRHD